jgi:hypothetical protein
VPDTNFDAAHPLAPGTNFDAALLPASEQILMQLFAEDFAFELKNIYIWPIFFKYISAKSAQKTKIIKKNYFLNQVKHKIFERSLIHFSC